MESFEFQAPFIPKAVHKSIRIVPVFFGNFGVQTLSSAHDKNVRTFCLNLEINKHMEIKMKNAILKRSVNVLAVLLAFAVSSEALAQKLSRPKEATLISRYTVGNYHTAAYSFRYGGQGDLVPARNNWEILFEGYDGRRPSDEFLVNMVTDDVSAIFDLGWGSCDNVQSTSIGGGEVSLLRGDKRMLFWGDGDRSRVPVKQGHCYLTVNTDGDGTIVSLFHVKSHTPSYKVDINEIQVLFENKIR